MAGSDGVNVVLLHGVEIESDQCLVDDLPLGGRVIVAINTLNQRGFTIHAEFTRDDLNTAESDGKANAFQHLIAFIVEGHK